MNNTHIDNATSSLSRGTEPSFWKTAIDGWNNFWFRPADPTILGMIRIGVGLLALYTLLAYTPDLQNLMGKHSLYSLEKRLEDVHFSPWVVYGLDWAPEMQLPPVAENEWQDKYAKEYMAKWNEYPPLPWPKDQKEADEIDAYRTKWGGDPRQAVAIGTPVWSIWFHVTDPNTMFIIHWIFIFVVFLYLIGFGTRVTSVLAWFIYLCYNHRSPVTLFGYDTMMIVTMMYLMIGPSGAALSVDRLLSRWWRSRRGKGEVTNGKGHAALGNERPAPSLTANLAIRLLQVHLCFIYGAAGLAKLKGSSWWNGNAVWGTLANYEFAPMSSPVYMWLLSALSEYQFVLQTFVLCGTYFTLFFEITYPFLIWNKYTRWLLLFMAVVLHGVIGLFMGLRTFALIMLIMNMAFLPTPVVYWLLGRFKALPKMMLEVFSGETREQQKATKESVPAGAIASSAPSSGVRKEVHVQDLRHEKLRRGESRKFRRKK